MTKDDQDEKDRLQREEELNSCLKRISTIRSHDMDELNRQRQEAVKYLNADEEIVPTVKGRSKYTTTDLSDTIEWILPQLMKVFAGKEEVVDLQPQGAEDVEVVQNTSDLVNYQLKRKNNWFLVLNDAFRDGLGLKTSVIKRQWHKETKTMDKDFENLSEMQFQTLQNEPNAQLVKMEATTIQEAVTVDDPFFIPKRKKDKIPKIEVSPAVKTYNVTMRYTFSDEYPLIEAVPPEEIGYPITTKDIRTADFVYHEIRVDEWQIKDRFGEEIFKQIKDTYKDMKNESNAGDVFRERFASLGYDDFMFDSENQKWILYECYYRKKDTGEHWITTICGDVICQSEHNVYEGPPFRMGTPVKMAHMATGRSMFDLIKNLHRINTSLTRQYLDSIYFILNGRWVIDESQIDLPDFLKNNRPGGVVRGSVVNGMATGVAALPPPPVDAANFQLGFQFVQQMKDKHLPISQAFQGINPNALNDTWRGMSMQVQQATQQIEMMASLYAEMLIGPLVGDIVDLNIQFLKEQTAVRVLNNPKIISPDNITNKADVIVNVGIGTGNKQETIMYMQQLLGMYAQVFKAGVPVVTPQNVYKAMSELIKAMGFKNTDDFVTNPQQAQAVQALADMLMQLVTAAQQMGIQLPPQMIQALPQIMQSLGIKPPQQPQGQTDNNELSGGTFPGQTPPALPMQPRQPMNMASPMQGGNLG